MACSVFYVVTHGNQWRVKYGDQHYGPYMVDWAKRGHNAQVLGQGSWESMANRLDVWP
jgi:hypothetical protein